MGPGGRFKMPLREYDGYKGPIHTWGVNTKRDDPSVFVLPDVQLGGGGGDP